MNSTIERPILFNGEMVRAILDGRKTQTRRVVKQVPHNAEGATHNNSKSHWWWWQQGGLGKEFSCPFGVPGDRLWVREAWRCIHWPGDGEDGPEVVQYKDGQRMPVSEHGRHTLEYENWSERMADQGFQDLVKAGFTFDGFGQIEQIEDYPYDDPPIRWRPSIHMPRWASRITLEVLDVRVERLNDISEEDAVCEGVDRATAHSSLYAYRDRFREIWESTYGQGSWAENPWVWVVEFRRVD